MGDLFNGISSARLYVILSKIEESNSLFIRILDSNASHCPIGFDYRLRLSLSMTLLDV